MSAAQYQAIARRHLDAQLDELRERLPSVPADGWIQTVRSALGMSVADLARRVGVTSSAVRRYEESERAGTIQLATLRRVADALGARIEYAVVPIQPLETMVEAQALAVATRELDAVNHSMALELQRPAGGDDELVRQRAQELRNSSRLWRDG